MDMKICIGTNINKLMKEKNISSLKELSSHCGIPLATLHHLKNGRIPRNWSSVAKLAHCLGVSMFYLVFGQEDPIYTDFSEKLLKQVFSGDFQVQINVVKRINNKEDL